MKLWQKTATVNSFVNRFTVGKDRELDLQLAYFDILGSLAHVNMLENIGLVSREEREQIKNELKAILKSIEEGTFVIEAEVEDVHSQIEWLLKRLDGLKKLKKVLNE